MLLSVDEAATLLGLTPRAVRSKLQRGELPGRKQGGAWKVPREALPLDEAEKRRLAARADAIRAAVDEALPSRIAARRGSQRSLVDVDAFRIGHAALLKVRQTGCQAAEATMIDALTALAESWVAWDVQAQLIALRTSRACCGRATAQLLAAGPLPPEQAHLTSVLHIEQELVPALNGRIRQAEGRARQAAR